MGQNFPNIVVGEIKEITKHPNADKLQVVKVSVTSHLSPNASNLTIVCGAPNIKVGQKVPVALVGAKFEEFEIKKAEIRGVESHGMLCSEKELDLGEDHSGIMILDAGAKVGQPLSELIKSENTRLPDGQVIDAELTPNRGDCLSMVGMAREVGATFNRKFKMPVVKRPNVTSKKKIEVEVIDKNLCPRYVAKVIEGVKIGPSPKWLQDRLVAAGVRPISNIVDVTNYVMLELGQPLHAFDFSKLQATMAEAQHGQASSKLPPKIIVRRAKTGERITTLDNQERKLTGEDLLICDSKKPVALAGVMGGLNSEVDDKTTDVVLEAASFNPAAIRKTAQRLNLRSEASNRFEKGIPLALPEMAIERAAELIIETAGGKAGERTDVLSAWIWVQRVGLELSRIGSVLGAQIEETKAIKILQSLGFEVERFDFKTEARKHLGKPYVFGASYKTHGDMAFDCSYLTDYIYSKVGKFIGYTSLAQFELGESVDEDNLQPGDILFVKGHIDKSAADHYFMPDGKGNYRRITLEKPKEVGHNALYIGHGRIVHARHFDYDSKNKKWKKLPTGKVVEEGVEAFTKNPEYLGARRYLRNPRNYLAVTVPWWRLDIRIEEDILEELARINGYDKIPATLPSGQLPGKSQNLRTEIERDLKRKLTFQGLTEVISYSFISEKLANLSGVPISELPKIDNPLSIDQAYMRGALWPSLLEVAAKNQDAADQLKIFEIANTYRKGRQELHLAAVARLDGGKQSFYELKGILWSVLREFKLANLDLRPATVEMAEDGQGAEIWADKKLIGKMGIVSSKIRQKIGQKTELAVAEIYLSAIDRDFGRQITYKPLPKYPRASRDVNIVVDEEILVSEVVKSIAVSKTPHLLNYRIESVYEGKPARQKRGGDGGLPENKKSVTISLEFGSEERTLTDEEIEQSVSGVVKALTKIGGELRS
jgi:phenylalanyl-tRNA synthetase beta subunit